MTTEEREEVKQEILRHCADRSSGDPTVDIDGSAIMDRLVNEDGIPKEEARGVLYELVDESKLEPGSGCGSPHRVWTGSDSPTRLRDVA
jgi:hypothetical protein